MKHDAGSHLWDLGGEKKQSQSLEISNAEFLLHSAD